MSDTLDRLPDVMDRICDVQMGIRLPQPYQDVVPLFAYPTPMPQSITPQQYIWTNELRRTRYERGVSMRSIEFVDRMRFFIGLGAIQEDYRTLLGHAVLGAMINAFDDDISLNNLVDLSWWVDESESGSDGASFGYLGNDWYIVEQRLAFNIQGPREFVL